MGRYCPHLLADYLLLAAAPPTARSKALLHYSSPAAGASASGDASAAAAAATAAAAAAAAEEDVLAGEPLSAEAAAALRHGAYALYGACSAAEVRAGGSWPCCACRHAAAPVRRQPCGARPLPCAVNQCLTASLLPLQIQFLYASLGGAGGPRGGASGATAAWRASLAALKAGYEAHYKYSGKV